jgi:GEVED domain
MSISSGSNALRFAVPTSAILGGSYARFRFSTTGVASPDGFGGPGEVEDYLINVLPPIIAPIVP